MDKDMILAALSAAPGGRARFADIAAELGVGKRDLRGLRSSLEDLVVARLVEDLGRNEYRIVRRGRQAVVDSIAGPVGRITVHPAGYGFVALEDGTEDVFVPAKYRGAALDGDSVELETWDGYKGTEGRVVRVVSRGRAKITATLRRGGHNFYLEPDDPRVATDLGKVALEGAGTQGGKVGQSVLAEIVTYPTATDRTMTARIVRVLGNPDDPRTEIEKILACGDIPTEFPAEAIAQAEGTPQEVSEADLADRIDLRDRPFVTIDPETARDFDDALCFETGPHGGPRIWVAVADVSHYVRPEDPLDRESQIRGVSVYLPDRVVPMLPFQLSSGVCSLNPNVDRCAMVARLDYSNEGELLGTAFSAAVIRSHARLDYPGAAASLRGDFRGRREIYRPWADTIEKLDSLAQKLRAKRRARGALELDVPEPKVILDADDPLLVRDVVRAKADPDVKQAYELVEEFMIAANEAVGAFFKSRDATTVWRVHAPPDPERLATLVEVLRSYGIASEAEDFEAVSGMNRVLSAVADHRAARSLSFLVLRSLKQAVYDTKPQGHFGLASPDYLHFTSPIRRYPDVLVHRLLKFYLHQDGLASGGGGSLSMPTPEKLQELASISSKHERRAMEAEREAVSMYRAYLIRDQLGEQMPAIVSAVTSFGAFVEIDSPFIEGLIKTVDLGDEPFELDTRQMRLRGRRTGTEVALGDSVLVELANVSVNQRRIDFRLVSRAGKRVGSRDAAKTEPGEASGGRGRGAGRAERRTRTSERKQVKKPAARGGAAKAARNAAEKGGKSKVSKVGKRPTKKPTKRRR